MIKRIMKWIDWLAGEDEGPLQVAAGGGTICVGDVCMMVSRAGVDRMYIMIYASDDAISPVMSKVVSMKDVKLLHAWMGRVLKEEGVET
jgi:hypothetical protein